MTKTRPVRPEPAVATLLPGAQFADAYRVDVRAGVADAMTAARIMIGRSPA
jgi:hypothetical protein